MWEVEQKFWLSEKESVLRLLGTLGAVVRPTLVQDDTYFAHPSRDFRSTDEALRIRRQAEGDAETTWLTYKGPRLPGPAKTRRELETPLAGPHAETLAETLTALGFVAVATVHKVRESYRLSIAPWQFLVCLDQVRGLGTFLGSGDGRWRG